MTLMTSLWHSPGCVLRLIKLSPEPLKTLCSDLNSFKPRFPMLCIVSAGPFELKQKPAAQRQACKLPHIDYYTALVRYLY